MGLSVHPEGPMHPATPDLVVSSTGAFIQESLRKQGRIVFMGTPQFAVPSLKALIAAGYEITLVVTSPLRQAGRGLHQSQSPVGRAAKELGINVFQPERIRLEESVRRIAETRPTVVVEIGRAHV